MTRRLGEHGSYTRYVVRGGETTTRPYPLGAVVHDQYHFARVTLDAAAVGRREDPYQVETTTERGNALPAGPEGSSIASAERRRGKAARNWPAHIWRAIYAALGEGARQYADWVERVEAAIEELRDHEPHGELMRLTLRWVCVEGRAEMARSEGWRHYDRGQALALYGGDEDRYHHAVSLAWELVAVRVVEPEVLARAREMGSDRTETKADYSGRYQTWPPTER